MFKRTFVFIKDFIEYSALTLLIGGAPISIIMYLLLITINTENILFEEVFWKSLMLSSIIGALVTLFISRSVTKTVNKELGPIIQFLQTEAMVYWLHMVLSHSKAYQKGKWLLVKHNEDRIASLQKIENLIESIVDLREELDACTKKNEKLPNGLLTKLTRMSAEANTVINSTRTSGIVESPTEISFIAQRILNIYTKQKPNIDPD